MGNKVQTIDIDSVNFHFKRRDFEKWIEETIGDSDLADKIGKIPRSLQGGKLRENTRNHTGTCKPTEEALSLRREISGKNVKAIV